MQADRECESLAGPACLQLLTIVLSLRMDPAACLMANELVVRIRPMYMGTRPSGWLVV